MTTMERVARAAGVLGFVVLIGPALGALMFPTPFAGPTIWWTLLTHEEGSIADRLSVLGYVVLGSYALGILPASVAAVVMAFETWRRGRFGYVVAALAGLIGTAAAGIYAAHAGADAARSNGVALLVFYVPISVAAAVLCRWLLGVLRILPRAAVVQP